jgi:hypothetical protein
MVNPYVSLSRILSLHEHKHRGPNLSDDRLFTAAEVASVLQIRKTDVYAACDKGALNWTPRDVQEAAEPPAASLIWNRAVSPWKLPKFYKGRSLREAR